MILWLKTPKSLEVAKYIECFWFLERQLDIKGNEFPRLNPDPSPHLILSPPEQAYSYKFNNEKLQGIGSHLLYPCSKTIQLDHSKPLTCLGIKFHVGALYAFNPFKLSQPLLDTVQKVSIASDYAITSINELELLALAKNNGDKCCQQLEQSLMPWLSTGIEDRHSALVRKILPLLTKSSVGTIGEQLNCSQRTIERSFLRVAGMSLKQCQSMNKLEAILEYLYQRENTEIDWLDIAYQFGFSDQPHLIRYLKKQLNLTPKDYAQHRGFTIDVYGGVGI